MPRRPGDWLRQARADLESARVLTSAGRYEGCAFFAHQAAEKAIKALWEARGVEARGQALTGLTEPLEFVPAEVSDSARRLDRHYVGARYPNTLPKGRRPTCTRSSTRSKRFATRPRMFAYVEGRLSNA